MKNRDGEARTELNEVTKELYIEGEWPTDFVNVIITLPKKKRPTKYSEYRSLVNHVSKTMFKVLTRRLTYKAEQL